MWTVHLAFVLRTTELGYRRPHPFIVPFTAPWGILRKGEASAGFNNR